jgi:hypothetical protein
MKGFMFIFIIIKKRGSHIFVEGNKSSEKRNGRWERVQMTKSPYAKVPIHSSYQF